MRVIMVSLAFAPARVIIECMKQLYKFPGDIKFEHYVLNNHYPIDKDRNDLLLKTLFDSYGCKYFDLGANTGLAAGYNYLIKQANIQDDDIVIGADLDTYPVSPNWMNGIVNVMQADPTIGWCGLMNQHAKKELADRGCTTHTIANTVCLEGHTACVQSIIGWSGKSLNLLQELKEQNKWYGGMEVVSFPRLKQLNLRWVYLPQYNEEFSSLVEADRCYVIYKWSYAHLRNTTLDFESWIKEDPSRLDMK